MKNLLNLTQKTKTKIKLKLEKFFKEQLWQHILVIAFVFACAFITDKYIEAILFCISHTVIRMFFDKQYHAGTTFICLMITLTVAFFGIAYTLPLSISLLSTIPMCFFIAWIGYVCQDRVDQYVFCSKLQDELDNLTFRLQIFKRIDVYQMSEENLRNYGASRQLSEIQQDILVMRIKEHLKISEICKYRNYGRTTIKYHIAQIKKKLEIDFL